MQREADKELQGAAEGGTTGIDPHTTEGLGRRQGKSDAHQAGLTFLFPQQDGQLGRDLQTRQLLSKGR